MNFVTELFSTEVSTSVDFRNLTVTSASGVITKTYSATTDLTVDALMWTGSAVDSVVSERDRANVDAVIVFDYELYTTTIGEDAKVIIGAQDYSIVIFDNIANQNEAMQVNLKRFS